MKQEYIFAGLAALALWLLLKPKSNPPASGNTVSLTGAPAATTTTPSLTELQATVKTLTDKLNSLVDEGAAIRASRRSV